MGKWSKYKEAFPRFQEPPEVESKKQKEIQRLKFEYEHPEMGEVRTWAEDEKATRIWIQSRFRDLKLRKEEAEAALNVISAQKEAAMQLLLEIREDAELSDTLVRDADGYGYGESPTPYASVSDHEVFKAWVAENGWEDLYTINFNTLNAMVKRMIEANEELPAGVSVWMKDKVVLYKPK